MRLTYQYLFYFQVPVVQNVAHHNHIGFRQRLLHEAARHKFDSSRKSVRFHVLFEDRSDLRQVETNSLNMGMSQRHLRNQIALGGSDIQHDAVFAPRKFSGNSEVGRMTPPGHGLQELFQPGWFGVKSFKGVSAPFPHLMLRKSSSQRRGEVFPERIESMVGHLKHAADVGWLA